MNNHTCDVCDHVVQDTLMARPGEEPGMCRAGCGLRPVGAPVCPQFTQEKMIAEAAAAAAEWFAYLPWGVV